MGIITALGGLRIFCRTQSERRGEALSLSLRKQVLEKVDEELSRGNDRAALSLIKQSQAQPGGLRCFGAARQVVLLLCPKNKAFSAFYSVQVPQRLYRLDELKLNGIEPASLLSPVDTTLGSIERNLQIAAILGGVAAWRAFGLSPQQILYTSLGLLFLWTLDLVSFDGGIGSLVLDTIGHTFSQKYHNRVIQTDVKTEFYEQHEAGHFLIAYLVGILPRGYTLSSFEALKKEGSLNVQAGTTFVDFEFVEEVKTGKVSAAMLNRFSCIALAGVATEYLLYGQAEGGLTDINKIKVGLSFCPFFGGFRSVKLDNRVDLILLHNFHAVLCLLLLCGRLFPNLNFYKKLDGLLKSLGFTQKKADSQVRWAVLNTILLLRRHEEARAKLADAMARAKSVGSCIDVIEEAISDEDLQLRSE
ncbi:hypothetical protein Cgig2_003462 [Carnegiea gigantea]|uniref:Stress regulated protein n=1 Tax=Carnegiea gigantea TaxID=171969 RepID=A0A9Q1KBE0_9CARY|nr:hypothetical protein Cgig2_003462 [Carnegiea gigantea]